MRLSIIQRHHILHTNGILYIIYLDWIQDGITRSLFIKQTDSLLDAVLFCSSLSTLTGWEFPDITHLT